MTAKNQFNLIAQAWQDLAKTELQYFYYQLGPFVLCLQIAQPPLALKIIRAFEHLRLTTPHQADFTICLWDTHLAPTAMPALDWALIYQYGDHGYCEGSVYLHYFCGIDALSVFDSDENTGYYVVKDTALLPWWVSGSPLQVLLHWWLRSYGMQLTHTAAIGDEHGALLLTGKGGSGKSTTTLACLTAGLYYLGEDYCILAPGTPAMVYSIYQSAKWADNTRKLFPHYENFIRNPHEAATEKALVFYHDFFPQQLTLVRPIKALVSLSVGTDALPHLKTCESSESLTALMMSTLRQLPVHEPRSVAILKAVSAQLDHYQLCLGTNSDANVALIKKLLAS